MNVQELIKPTPWDTSVLGMPTWEVLEYREELFKHAIGEKGHYSIKVEPLADTRLLHAYGFYYCDTLIEPSVSALRLRAIYHPDASISKDFDHQALFSICRDAFEFGRFHRDFGLSRIGPEQRYMNWLSQLIAANRVFGLFWKNALVGFIGYRENILVLHAVAKEYRGRGLSKYWWSLVCSQLLAERSGYVESSISASNLAVLNLYASLGFSFKKAKDVYHLLVE